MTPRIINYTKHELADMVWLKTGRIPLSVRTQALLVVAEFEDDTFGVWHIDELER